MSTLHLADRIVVLDDGPGGRAGHPRGAHRRAARCTGALLSGLEEDEAAADRGQHRGAGRHRATRSTDGDHGRRHGRPATGRDPAPCCRSHRRRAEHGPGPGRRRRRLAAQPGADPGAAGPGGGAAPRSATSPTVDLDTESRHDRIQPARAAARVPPAAAARAGAGGPRRAGRRWPGRCWSRPASTTASRRARRRCCSRRRASSSSSRWPTWSTRSARRSSPVAPPSGSCCRCASASGPSCSGCRSTTTSARWPAGS